MPNIHRFLLKTLCVFGVTFTLTLPHNNALSAQYCCNCTGNDLNNGCYNPSGDPMCDPDLVPNNCYANDQEWCTKKGGTAYCSGTEVLGTCPNGWLCNTSGGTNPPVTDEPPKNCKDCINQYIEFQAGLDRCFLYDTEEYPLGENYDNFKWTYLANNPDDYCYKNGDIDKLYDVTCNTDDKYYSESSVYCDIQSDAGTHTNTVTACHGCSSEPCYDCNDYSSTEFWISGHCFDSTDTEDPRKAIVCITPEMCGYDDPTEEMYKKITDAPGAYTRVKQYSFSTSNNGSCSFTWVDLDCELGYFFDSDTNTCHPCPTGYVGEEDPKQYNISKYAWWKPICVKCPTGQSTFKTKTVSRITIIDEFLNAQKALDNACNNCPKGYIWESSTDNTLPGSYQEPSFCTLCNAGTYNDTEGATDCKNCSDIVKKGDSPFTSDTPDPSKGLINDSIQMCYIDPNVMLSDSLGTIKLSEEIGSGTKLYHQ